MTTGSVAKPVLGPRPRYVVVMLRTQEIGAAIQRYAAEGKPIPEDWLNEIRDLNGCLVPKSQPKTEYWDSYE